MTIDPLYTFVLAGLFSPGPNVILLTASGARFGFRATLPHILGVALGCGVVSGLTAFGLGALLLAQPALTFALKIIAAAWILYMAWKLLLVARNGAKTAKAKDQPFTFVEAVLFQWVNPKIWAIAVAASAGFPGGLSPLGEALRLGSTFSGINLGVCLFWTFAGSLLTYLLTTPRAWSVFNTIMALALAATIPMVFL